MYIEKIEAAISKPKKIEPFNPKKPNGAKKPKPVTKPKSVTKPSKPRSLNDKIKQKKAEGKISFTSLTNTKKLVPMLEQEFKKTDPFSFNDETWINFLKKTVPSLITALLIDMSIAKSTERSKLLIMFQKAMRNVKTK